MKKLLHAVALGAAAGLATAAPAPAPAPAAPRAGHALAAPGVPAPQPCRQVRVDPPTRLSLGKSQVIPLEFPAARVIVGGRGTSPAGRPAEPTPGARPDAALREPQRAPNLDGVADTEVQLLGPTELFFLAHRTGTMNVVLQGSDGRCVVKDIVVTVDPSALQAKLGELLPGERGIQVRGADGALVLTGSVSDAVRLDQAMALATAYGDGKHVVNLLRVDSPQQVMLEVKIAEVSKTILDHLGLDFTRLVTNTAGTASSMISGIVGGSAGLFSRFAGNLAVGGVGGTAQAGASNGTASSGASLGTVAPTQVQNPDGSFTSKLTVSPPTVSRSANLLGVNAQKKDGIIRILAEPNIMAVSGQTASFLSGGKIFIPVAQNRDAAGGATFTLEEKEFGVGLKFTPTVLDGGRVNLKLVSEASELSQTGSPFTVVNGTTAILPSLATRRVDTTVQLGDGQSFVIAGLIKNNLNQAVDKVPGLGEVPVMGALFRSTEFQTDQTELMFVVTPHLVKPLAGPVTLPTDLHVPPTRNEVMLTGSGESAQPAAAPVTPAPAAAKP